MSASVGGPSMLIQRSWRRRSSAREPCQIQVVRREESGQALPSTQSVVHRASTRAARSRMIPSRRKRAIKRYYPRLAAADRASAQRCKVWRAVIPIVKSRIGRPGPRAARFCPRLPLARSAFRSAFLLTCQYAKRSEPSKGMGPRRSAGALSPSRASSVPVSRGFTRTRARRPAVPPVLRPGSRCAGPPP